MNDLPNNTACPHCGRYNNRAITIDALIVKDNTILLIKRNVEPFKDYWAIPGGHMEWDISAEETVIKEVKEETSLDVTHMKFLKAYTDPKRDPMQKVTLAYVVDTSGEPMAGDDAKEYQWFNLNNLPELAFDHQQIIKDYRKNKDKIL